MNRTKGLRKSVNCFLTGGNCTKLSLEGDPDSGKTRVFTLMPFTDSHFDDYQLAIKERYASYDFECRNATESIFMKGEIIICKLCEEIAKANLVIADLSERNPNVYYELGLAHAQKKTSIVLVKTSASEKPRDFFYKFLDNYSSLREYKDLEDLAEKLTEPYGKPFDYQPPTEYNEVYGVICLIPHLKEDDKKTPRFSDVFRYGIEKSIKSLAFPGDDLMHLDRRRVFNLIQIAHETEDHAITNVLKKIITARYCVIDITEGYPEVYYWLGFIHGLRINSGDILRPDLSYLYITQGQIEGLPFDIRSAKVTKYNSVNAVYHLVKTEIENIEAQRLRELNERKCEFWSRFQFRNTTFFLGAVDMRFTDGKRDDDRVRSRVSVQDIKAFNRIAYLLLTIGERQPFQYKMVFVELLSYLDGDRQQIEFDKNKLNCFSGGAHSDNFVMIGASCINAATEIVMRNLYLAPENGYIFRTSSEYKSRSIFWNFINEASEESAIKKRKGIYVAKSTIENSSAEQAFIDDQAAGNKREIYRNERLEYLQVGRPEYKYNTHLRAWESGPTQDTGLLIIIPGRLEIDDYIPTKGEVVLLSGFSKYGTFQLSALLSYYYNGASYKKDSISVPAISKSIEAEELFRVINKTINLGGISCIEAVFEFKNPDKQPCDCDKTLTALYEFNKNKQRRRSLLRNFVETKKSETAPPGSVVTVQTPGS